MTKEQLAELEFPNSNHPTAFRFVAEKERSAFIKGLEHAVEFMDWWVDGDDAYPSIEIAFEIFLDEKYGSNEQ